MTLQQDLQLALDVLKHPGLYMNSMEAVDMRAEAITALEARLANWTDEPVIAVVSASNDCHAIIDWILKPCPAGTELYLHPAEPVVPEG